MTRTDHQRDWPTWWDWNLEVSPHIVKRMATRGFSEVELRDMLQQATALRDDHEAGRYIINARLESADWEIIIEPDHVTRRLVAVTGYRAERH